MNDAFSFKELGKVVINVFSTLICANSLQEVLWMLLLKYKTEVFDSFSGIRLFL